MKYWIITTEFPPFFGGGISTYCFQTANMLSKKGNEVTIFMPDNNIDKDIEINYIQNIDNNSKIKLVKINNKNNKLNSCMGEIPALSFFISEVIIKMIKDGDKPDVIESQDYLGIAYFLIKRKYLSEECLKEIPIVLTLHTPKFIIDKFNRYPIYRLPDYWIGEMEKFCIKAADYIFAPSRYIVETLNKYMYLDSKKVGVVFNPFFIEKIDYSYQGNIDKNCLYYVGRIQYNKGVIKILNTIKELWDKGNNIKLNLIGGDSIYFPRNINMSENIKKRYYNYIKDGLLCIYGNLPPNELNKILSKKIIINASFHESCPYVIIENMARENVIISNLLGGQKEFIEHNNNAYVYDIYDDESLKKCIIETLNKKEKELNTITQNARNTILEKFNYNTIYSQKVNLLDRIINKEYKIYPFVYSDNMPNEENIKLQSNLGNNKKIKLLSIIIPYYNMGKYIDKTLESIMYNHYHNFEIIIVNDGSDEQYSINKLNEIETKYPQIKIYNKKNRGLSDTRNFGAKLAKGEYITFLDPDDYIEPSYYIKAITLLEKYSNISYVGCWLNYFGEEYGKWITWDVDSPYFLVHSTINTASVVFRYDDFIKYALNDVELEYGMEDYESIISLYENNKKGIIIPEFLFNYRIRKDSMSKGFNIYNLLYSYQFISKKHEKLFEKYAIDIINILNCNGPFYLYDNPTFDSQLFKLNDLNIVLNTSSVSVPHEIKSILNNMWQNKHFRFIMKIFIKLKIHKLFYK